MCQWVMGLGMGLALFRLSWMPCTRGGSQHPALLLSFTLILSSHPGGLEPGMQAEAVLGAGQLQLERLRLRLNAPGALAMQLGQLQQEAELQQDRIRAFESDLVEIRADKQNLEDILRSLPEGCSK